LIGGPVLIWRALTAHWVAQATGHQAETAREAHFTSLFTKAVEQLGATRDTLKKALTSTDGAATEPHTFTETEPNLEVRLGAVYALERVARDSERDHWPIMEVLCAYVRNPQNSGAPIARPADAFSSTSNRYMEWLISLPPPRVDIQAVLTVLARRQSVRVEREHAQGHSLDFGNANLQRAIFLKGQFAGANFVGAYLDRASLRGADLRNTTFMTAHLEEADMVRTRLDGSWLGSGVMNGASLHQASCERTNFDKTYLNDAAFNGARLVESDFYGAHLRDTRFNGAVLRDVRFEGAFASGASFLGAELLNVEFLGAKLYAAQFVDTKFHGGSFYGSQLDGAAFFGSDLTTVTGLSMEQISIAMGDASTILPPGMARPSEWATKVLSGDERSKLVATALHETRFRA
jgi:uncharacterized protein YjbI with pentapeptide repeats